MNSNAVCPINYKRVDENVARFNAAITVLLLAVYLISGQAAIVVFLLADFLLRGFELPQYSPLARVSKGLTKVLSIQPKIINAGPKFFAAKIGAFFSLSILVSLLAGVPSVAVVLSVVFGVCAFLEAAIGFCLACTIYPYLFKLSHFSIYKSH